MYNGSSSPQRASSSKVAEFNQFYYDSYRVWSTYYSQAYRDLRAYAGDNWTQQEKERLRSQGREILELNKMRRVINVYTGYERENRTAIHIGAMENSDELTADQISRVMYNDNKRNKSAHIWSQAFEHHLKTGLAMVGMYPNYEDDLVNGDLDLWWKPFNAIMLDPYFTDATLKDANNAATRDLLGKEQILSLAPWMTRKDIEELPKGIQDNKFQYLGLYKQYYSTFINKNLLTYDQYWYVTSRKVTYKVDLSTGEMEEFKGEGEEYKDLKREVYEMRKEGHPIEIIDTRKKTVNLTIMVAGQEIYDGADLLGLDRFPFMPLVCYHEPLIDTYELKIQGLIRSMKDAQRQYNKRNSQIIDIMETVLNSGYIFEEGAIRNPKSLLQSGQGKLIPIVDNSKYSVNSVREIQPINVPQGTLEYAQMLDKDIMEIPGGNESLQGVDSGGNTQVSGALAERRASQGLMANRGIFDNYEFMREHFGVLHMEAIQKNYSAGKVQRILNEEPTEEFHSKDFGKYDSVSKQGVYTQTQKEAYYVELLRLLELGAPIPWDEILEAIPLQGSSRLRKKIEELQQQQQQQAQAEAEDKQRLDKLVEAKTFNEVSLGKERIMRGFADIGLYEERKSEIEHNNWKSFLDMVKAIQEIQNFDSKEGMEIAKVLMDWKLQQDAVKRDERKQELTNEPIKQLIGSTQ